MLRSLLFSTNIAAASASSLTAPSTRLLHVSARRWSKSSSSSSSDSSSQQQQPKQSQQRDSTSALDYKLHHRLRRLPPLPSIDPPPMQASDAVSNILYNTPTPSREPFKRHILNTLVQNEPGVLSRVAGCLAARGFNIDSLVVCKTEVSDLSRMCIVLRGQDGVIEQARRQLEDLVPVWAVLDYTHTSVIERELMLVKVSILGPEYYEQSLGGGFGSAPTGPNGPHDVPPELIAERQTDAEMEHRSASSSTTPELSPTEALRIRSDHMRSIISLASQFRASVVDVSNESVIVEISAKSKRCDAFLKLVRPYGVLECARSGTMVLPRSPIVSSWSGDEAGQSEEAEIMDAALLPPG